MSWGDELRPHTRELMEVQQAFGIAMFAAAALERGLASVVVLMCRDSSATPDETAHELQASYKQTLGRLVRRFEQDGGDGDLVERLDRDVKLRNWLAHGFFVDRYLLLFDHRRYGDLVTELEAASDQFETSLQELLSYYLSTYVALHHNVQRDDIDATIEVLGNAVRVDPSILNGISGWSDFHVVLERLADRREDS